MNYTKSKRKRFQGRGNTTSKFPAVSGNGKRIIEGRPVVGNQRKLEREEFKTTLKRSVGPDQPGVW